MPLRNYLVLGVCIALSSLHASETVTVRFRAIVPRHFNNLDRIHLAGNLLELGSWSSQAVQLSRSGPVFEGSVSLPANVEFQYKVHNGDWFHAETTADGKEKPNRVGKCSTDCLYTIDIENFRLHSFHPAPKTVTDSVRFHFDFYSEEFQNYRNIAVFLPPGYDSDRDARFPVLYALDGNNLMDRGSASFGFEWGLDETLNQQMSSGGMKPFIVVAIYNTSRRGEEYLPCNDNLKKILGQADRYLQFMLREIKPFIDSTYRTLPQREHTGLMGSSFGGEFALFAAHKYSKVFGRFASLSPALWVGNFCLFPMLEFRPELKPLRVWIDMGDREGWDDGAISFKNGVAEVKEAANYLQQWGLTQDLDLKRWTEIGGTHHELSWGKRLAQVLQFVMQ